MKLQTKIPITQSPTPLGYDSRIILLGSCFATHIGDKLAYFKFRITQNPFGILYQPQAILELLRRTVQKEQYTEDDVFFHNERWHCYDAHSQINAATAGELTGKLNSGLVLLGDALQECTHLIISLGSAWSYHLKSSGKPVANCHKVPQKEFDKTLAGVAQVQDQLKQISRLVRKVNPKLHFIVTISPVRHFKDGIIENQRSKSHLISALHQVVEEKHANTVISYFPSYEIMMDELRDYRYYGADLVHPNDIAIQYIWEIFREAWIAPAEFPLMEMVDTIQKGLLHKPFNPGSMAYTEFRRSLEEKMDYLKGQYNFITFE